jgi:hypothetical protein
MNQQPRTTTSPANRRNSRRFPVSNLAKIECRKGSLGLGPNLVVEPLDVSETGIRLVLKAALEPGHEAEIVLHGTGLSRPLKRLARVVWSLALETGTFVVGLRFDRPLPYLEMQRITKILR